MLARRMAASLELRLLAPNLVTAANIVAGFASMLAASDGRYELAVYLLLVAILLDICDGRLARWLRATSPFGQQLDSFSDALSFCAAPAFLAQRAILQPLGAVGAVASVAYLLAGVLRLVRFNLTADIHSKAHRTVGVPTPIGAGYVMALVLMRQEIPTVAASIVVLVLALLMVSRIHLPELSGKGLVSFTLGVGIANYFAVVIWPSWYTVGWWNLWNLVILLAARLEDRSRQPVATSG